jgi:DUF4097 and DUF4098 domain-containing protein YvlB
MGELEVAQPMVIRVAGRSAAVTVSARAGAALQVEGADVGRQSDGSVDVSSPRGSKINIICPENSALTVSTASGTVSVSGVMGKVHVVTASGRVDIEHAADLEVRTASARVDVVHCHHTCRVTTQSGRIDVGTSPEVELSTASARISVGEVDRATLRTVSGRIEVGASAAATVNAHTISGKVEVRVAGQAPARMQLSSQSGRIERHLPDGDGGAHIEVTTTSGAIAIERR